MIDGLECRAPAEPAVFGVRCNVFSKWLRSIDGNHQWIAGEPRYPYPRGNGPHEYTKLKFSYRRTEDRPDLGLRLWVDPFAREQLFRGLFAGPLAPAFEAPHELTPRMSGVLPPDFPYRSCKEDPFPSQLRSAICSERP